MSKYISDDITQKVLGITGENPNKLEKLLQNIKQFNNKFNIPNTDLPENDIQFNKKENFEFSDESIKKDAEAELHDYKTKSESAINQMRDDKEKELLASKDSVEKNYNNAKNETENYYNTIKENASNDALKRGLARSSIIINQLDAFNNKELETFNTLNTELTNSLNEIDFQLNSLESKQNQALADFDIEYAVKLNKKISDLKKEYTSLQNDVIKYNNQITETENNYKIKYAELEKTLKNADWAKEMDLVDLSAKYGSNVIDRYRQNQTLSMVSEYLNSLSSHEAVQALGSEELARILTPDQLTKLRNQYGV